METLSSTLPAGPELNLLYERLRRKAARLVRSHRNPHFQDAFDSAMQDGFLIFLRKLRTSDLPVKHPEAFALEIIKRTFWDYRRRAQRRELPHDPADLSPTPFDFNYRPRYADGNTLFASLPEPFLWDWYQRLLPFDQRLIDLRCLGYQDWEIAKLMDRSYGNIRNRFSKLLAAAREVVV